MSNSTPEVRFSDLDLLPEIQQALQEEKYVTPTPIQAACLPHVLEGRDLLGSAHTGTGKTAAFAIPILQRLSTKPRKAPPNQPLALILAPTRELAVQIGDSLKTYGRHLRLRHTLIYGGVGQGMQVRALKRGVHIVVATPGRLMDLIGQGHLDLKKVEFLAVDEADRMLDMGFRPVLEEIVAQMPRDRQSLFFSATFPPKVREFAANLLDDPVSIAIKAPVETTDQIDQKVIFLDRKDKRGRIEALLETGEANRVVIFVRTKRSAENVAKWLAKEGHRAAAIHGNKSQNARQRVLDKFRKGRLRVLVATDVAARGLDVDDITHVINDDVPLDPESYVHRIGRTGRAGASGIAITFCEPADHQNLNAIERLLGKRIPVEGEDPRKNHRPSSKRRGYGGGGGYKGKSRKRASYKRPFERDDDNSPAEGESGNKGRAKRRPFVPKGANKKKRSDGDNKPSYSGGKTNSRSKSGSGGKKRSGAKNRYKSGGKSKG